MSESANNPLKPGRSRMPGEQKDKIRAEQLARRLYKFANAKGKSAHKYGMSQAQVTAAKVLIDKGKPSLQAVEQTNIEEPKSEQEILGAITHLISTNPGLLKPLLDSSPGVRAALRSMLDGSPSVVEQPHTDSQAIQRA